MLTIYVTYLKHLLHLLTFTIILNNCSIQGYVCPVVKVYKSDWITHFWNLADEASFRLCLN